MRLFLLGLVAGASVLQMQPSLLSLPVTAGLFALSVGLIWLAGRFRKEWMRHLLHTGCGVAMGFAWATLFAQWYLRDALAASLEGQDVVVIGTIASLPGQSDQGVRFDFAIERALPIAGGVPQLPPRVSLGWSSGFQGRASQAVPDVQPGERWQLTVRLVRPHGNANPDGFDYEVWLLEQRLRATGSVRPDQNGLLKNQRLDRFVFSFGNVVERSRSWLRARIVAALPGKRFASVLVALVVGDQRGVQQSDWTIFTRTGIGHLISISGLHITMVAGLFAVLGNALWRRSFFTRASLPLLLPAQKFAALVGVLVAFAYVLLAGFGVPAQRTLYMLSVVALALWTGRLISVSHVLCLALGVVIVLDPWAGMSPGFWLSFGAVATILYASVGRVRPTPASGRWSRVWHVLRPEAHTQYVVTIGLVPLTMLLFGQVSLVSPIANAIAIPLISFVVTPLALIGSISPPPLIGWLLGVGHGCIEALAWFLASLSRLPGAVWSAPLPTAAMFFAAAVGTVWLLAPRGWPMRWAGLAGWLPLLVNAPTHPATGEFQVVAFDIGQGMALLVETAHHRLIYDTGPAYSPQSDGANRVILPYLKARGIERLDALMVSHSDTDHSGGALTLLEAMPVGWVSSSLAADSKIVKAASAHHRCLAGQKWQWDAIQFEMLHPGPSIYESPKWKPNAHSCTLKISNGAVSILLAGDIEAIQESELVNTYSDQLRSTVLLAPHHGSGTSSTGEFLQTVQPSLAIFQVGYRNRYHHPKPQVFARYQDYGIERVRTDMTGALTLRFSSDVRWQAYRTSHARYWYGR